MTSISLLWQFLNLFSYQWPGLGRNIMKYSSTGLSFLYGMCFIAGRCYEMKMHYSYFC